MAWRFDPQIIDIVFVQNPDQIQVSGAIDFGQEGTSDISIDTGDRTNDTSILDQGERVIDGNI